MDSIARRVKVGAIGILGTAALFLLLAVGVAASPGSVIDFEGLAEGKIVGSVASGAGISGDVVSGSVTVFGDSADAAIVTNAAVIFDATCTGGCTGGDDDLYKPALGNVLIIAQNLNDNNGDSLVDNPDDDDRKGGFFTFNFAAFGTGKVTITSLDVMDVEFAEGESGGKIEVFSGGPGGTLLATVAIPDTGDNGLATVAIGVSNVDYMKVTLNGSAAIDNIRLNEEQTGGEGCTPGYWRNHLDAWGPTGYSPSDDFDTVFGVNAFTPNKTLGQAVTLGGGGLNKLARHGVAALLNAAHPDVDYPLTSAQVIAAVQAAVTSGNYEPTASNLAAYNEAGCPIS